MVIALVDTSALYALLDADDRHHAEATAAWTSALEEDLVVLGPVVVESVALVRSRLGWDGAIALIDVLLPVLRTEVIDRAVHDAALSAYRRVGGGMSFVDRITIEYAQRKGISHCFAFDPDLGAAGMTRIR